MTTTIQVSDWTKELLDEFKEAEGHTSLDSVIRSLIPRALFEKDVVISRFYNSELYPKFGKLAPEEYNEILRDRDSNKNLYNPIDHKERLKRQIRGETMDDIHGRGEGRKQAIEKGGEKSVA
jgi:succinate dehydrogenase flavin-adding protein (antitoxin of CptAB toxin-antitoxin module)